jgi:hypothetical protein
MQVKAVLVVLNEDKLIAGVNPDVGNGLSEGLANLLGGFATSVENVARPLTLPPPMSGFGKGQEVAANPVGEFLETGGDDPGDGLFTATPNQPRRLLKLKETLIPRLVG